MKHSGLFRILAFEAQDFPLNVVKIGDAKRLEEVP